ncbi:hypothetical protein ScPMuIL_001443 [Solemya velum]
MGTLSTPCLLLAVAWISVHLLPARCQKEDSKCVVTPCSGQTNSTQFYDICDDRYIWPIEPGDDGTIGVRHGTITSQTVNPCVLTIRSCAHCSIRIWALDRFSLTPENLSLSDVSIGQCTPTGKARVPYLKMFDSYYENSTFQYYTRSDGLLSKSFHSVSSSVIVVLCHSNLPLNFTLYYKVERNQQSITGSFGTTSAYGEIRSPNFPHGYYENGDHYSYEFSSPHSQDKIMIIFDDWHVSPSSELFFDSDTTSLMNGQSHRPAIQPLRGLPVRMVFNTGVSGHPGNPRSYMGFKATYKIIRSFEMRPNTNCGGYLLGSVGGVLTFKVSHYDSKLYDCVWVVKKQPGFDAIFIKLITLDYSQAYDKTGSLDIHSGLTSDGPIVASVHLLSIDDQQRVVDSDSQGFYIRLRGRFTQNDYVAISYTSFVNHQTSNGCNDVTKYACRNDKCIPLVLQCDDYDHCGDGSDETYGCNAGNTDQDYTYQTSITLGVVVPLVVSLFVIVSVCIIFLVVRRCRRVAREQSERENPIPSISRHVSEPRPRRPRHNLNCFGGPKEDDDNPPSYEDTLRHDRGLHGQLFLGMERPYLMPPPPPTYDETMNAVLASPPTLVLGDMPTSSSSSDLDPVHDTANSSSSSGGERSGHVHSYSMSYSSDSDFDSPRGPISRSPQQVNSQTNSHDRQVGEENQRPANQEIEHLCRQSENSDNLQKDREDESAPESSLEQKDCIRGQKKPESSSRDISIPGTSRNRKVPNVIRKPDNRETQDQSRHDNRNHRQGAGQTNTTSRYPSTNNPVSMEEQSNSRIVPLGNETNNRHTATRDSGTDGRPNHSGDGGTQETTPKRHYGNRRNMNRAHSPRARDVYHPIPQPRQTGTEMGSRSAKPHPTPRSQNPVPKPRKYSNNDIPHAEGHEHGDIDGNRTRQPETDGAVDGNRTRQPETDGAVDGNRTRQPETDGAVDGNRTRQPETDARMDTHHSVTNENRQPALSNLSPGFNNDLLDESRGARKYNQMPFNTKHSKYRPRGDASNNITPSPLRGAQSELAINRNYFPESSTNENIAAPHNHPGDRFSMPYQLEASCNSAKNNDYLKRNDFNLQRLLQSGAQSEMDVSGRSKGDNSVWSSQPSLHRERRYDGSDVEGNTRSQPSNRRDLHLNSELKRTNRYHNVYENSGFEADED